MSIQTNQNTRKRPNSVSPTDAQAWLNYEQGQKDMIAEHIRFVESHASQDEYAY